MINEVTKQPTRGIKGVMFDLDGTLADTLTDLSNAANHALRMLGKSEHEQAAYRLFVGQGVANLFRDAMPEGTADEQARAVVMFKDYLAAHQYDHTGPYAGVPKMLDALTAAGMKMAVMSNKPDERCQEMVGELFGGWAWDAVRGHRAGYAVKPDPTAALEMAAELGVEPSDWCYVGDTRADMLTGKAAGFFTVGVTWGFREEDELAASGADAIIHQPGELSGLL